MKEVSFLIKKKTYELHHREQDDQTHVLRDWCIYLCKLASPIPAIPWLTHTLSPVGIGISESKLHFKHNMCKHDAV